MLEILLRTFLYRLQRWIGYPKMLPMNYTISLTNRCNCRCKTCNIYENKTKELSINDYREFFKSVGSSPHWVTLSGGEPFLRKDVVSICKVIYDESKPRIINIFSNGVLTNKIVRDVLQITKYCKKTKININLSIDEIGTGHDKIRNFDGCYDKAMVTFRKLKKIKAENLSVGIHTVISIFNSHNFSYIAQNLMDLNPDTYLTEIAENRHELGTMDEYITPSPWNYASAIDFLIHRIKNDKFTGSNKIAQSFRLEYYKMVKKMLRDEKFILPCYAGIASVQISSSGDVWVCCVKAKALGNIRRNSFKKIWFSKNLQRARKEIKNNRCYCPLANASYTNMLMNFYILLKVSLNIFRKKLR